jgi:ketosteroid isomerase-like protein
MSEENLEILRQVTIAFESGDWATAFESIHPEMAMDTTRIPVRGLARVYKGAEEVAGFWLEWLEAWGAQQIEDIELIDAGDRVFSWTQVHQLQGRGSGVEVSMPPYGWVTRMRDGMIVEATAYTDKVEALEAAGLSESNS